MSTVDISSAPMMFNAFKTGPFRGVEGGKNDGIWSWFLHKYLLSKAVPDQIS